MAEQIGVRKPPRTSIKLLQQFFSLMDRDERSYDVIAQRAGVTKQTLSYWRHGHRTPSAQALENVLQVLGYRLLMIPDLEPLELTPTGPFERIVVDGTEYIRADLVNAVTVTIDTKETQ